MISAGADGADERIILDYEHIEPPHELRGHARGSRMFNGRRRRARPQHVEAGALSQTTPQRDMAAQLAHDAVGHGQSQPGAGLRLGGEEGLERVSL